MAHCVFKADPNKSPDTQESAMLTTTTLKRTFAALSLTAGVILSAPSSANPAGFDGTWSVSLVSSGGMCGSGSSSVLTDP
jgi:hypothetical protein